MNATIDSPPRIVSSLPPPNAAPLRTPDVARRVEPPPRARPGIWSLVAVASGLAGIALVWFPGGGHGRPDLSGPTLLEALAVLGGAGLGVSAVALAITLLATIEPHGWRLAVTIAAIPIGVIGCLMASVVAFSG